MAKISKIFNFFSPFLVEFVLCVNFGLFFIYFKLKFQIFRQILMNIKQKISDFQFLANFCHFIPILSKNFNFFTYFYYNLSKSSKVFSYFR